VKTIQTMNSHNHVKQESQELFTPYRAASIAAPNSMRMSLLFAMGRDGPKVAPSTEGVESKSLARTTSTAESPGLAGIEPPPSHRDAPGAQGPEAIRPRVSARGENMSKIMNPSDSADHPSLLIALSYVVQLVLLVAIAAPIASPIWLPYVPTVHLFGVHVYLHGLLAMPLAVHLCILPMTLIMCTVMSILLCAEILYLPLSLLCLTVGIRLCSCRGIIPSQRDSPLSPSHPRGTSPAVSFEEAQMAAQRYLGHDEVWAALELEHERERLVRLVRLSWLLDLGDPGSSVHTEYGGVLPRRQELPEAAFIGVDELRRISRQAKRGVDWYLLFETIFAVQSGGGNQFKRVLRLISDVCSCKFVRRNIDELLPIIAVS
jgi:hypothetical protein